jgi:hypothetical protein
VAPTFAFCGYCAAASRALPSKNTVRPAPIRLSPGGMAEV